MYSGEGFCCYTGFLCYHISCDRSSIMFPSENRTGNFPSRFSRRKQSTKEHKWPFLFPLWVKKMFTFLRKYGGKLERIAYFVIKWAVRYFSGLIKISPIIYQKLQNVIIYAYKYLKWLLSLNITSIILMLSLLMFVHNSVRKHFYF